MLTKQPVLLQLLMFVTLVSAQQDVLTFNMDNSMSDYVSGIDENVAEMSYENLMMWNEDESNEEHKMEIESFDEELLEKELQNSNKISKSFAPWKVILMVCAAGVFVGLFILLVVVGVFQVMKFRHGKAAKQKKKETEQLEEIIVHNDSTEIKLDV